MAELTTTERLQPCLLDRLTDDEPQARQESRSMRVISMARYRDGVLRDIRWLFNSRNHLLETMPDPLALEQFPEVARSVLNYGVRDVCGLSNTSTNVAELEQSLEQALKLFESRVSRHTLSVKAVTSSDTGSPTTIAFEIRGDLWAYPVSEQLYIKTQIDLETGQCALG